jgi:hypothetical protein
VNTTFAHMLKKLINIFLILVFAIQLLPVQQMGKALFNNQFTEEIPHSLDTSPDNPSKSLTKSAFLHWDSPYANRTFTYILTKKPALLVTIPVNHSFEILVPPPNC